MLGEGSSRLKSENKLLKLEQAQDREAPLDGESTDEMERRDKQWASERNLRDHGGNLKYPLTHPPSHLERSLSFLTLFSIKA